MSRSRWYGFVVVWVFLAFVPVGCMRSFWNDFLDPSEVGRFHGKPVTREIRATLGLQDEETEITNATDPLPEDTIAVLKEYQIGPGDWVEVTVQELIRAGSITVETRKVSDLGYISLPVLGAVKIGGLTERQAEDLIKSKLKPDLLADPIVSVVVRQEQQRQFIIVGYVSRAGPVTIPRADFRMLEAISYAGQIPDEVETAYVIRRTSTQTVEEAAPSTQPATEPATEPSTAPSSGPPTAPVVPTSRAAGGLREGVDILMSDMGTPPGTGAPSPSPSSAVSAPARSGAGQSEIPPEDRRELNQALVPGAPGSATGSSSPAGTSPSQDAPKELSKWIWLNGEWVELRGEATTHPQPGLPETAPSKKEREPETSPWETVAAAGEETRVIAIPLKALRAGEARYNIVIKPGDAINLPTPDAGKRYYVMGHVRGPGAYAIPMEGITLRAAIAAAGGLDPYAWPSRCEIARRIAGDQEELHQVDLDRIFAMKDDDIRIKPGDVINVGTHPLSPFLVTISNGFRTTYGFGFVYDRNFADIDSFGGQANPRDRRRSEQSSRYQQLQSTFTGL